MIMIGCDFHPGFEEICLLDTETGLRRQHRLSHALGGEPVRQFYAGLPRPVRVGVEASGYSLWLEEMLEELGCELWVGDAARIRKAAPRKQKTDRNDARLLLQLLEEKRFSCSRPGRLHNRPFFWMPRLMAMACNWLPMALRMVTCLWRCISSWRRSRVARKPSAIPKPAT